jgi:osmotically-inducible protein OsmY
MKQLEWDPEVEASAIGVTAKDGVVTLTGYIDTYFGKLGAERAAKQVRGVRAVANDIQVRLRLERTDPEIAADAARALEIRATVPVGVQATIHSGHITLTGKVTWYQQRSEAEKAVRHIRGIRGINNHIEVVPTTPAKDVHRSIVAAMHRSADLDARHVRVTASNGVAVMTGHVSSWTQRELAERAARNAPGIVSVENWIEVRPPELDDVDEIC